MAKTITHLYAVKCRHSTSDMLPFVDILSICTDEKTAFDHIERAVREFTDYLDSASITYKVTIEHEGWFTEILEQNGWLTTFCCERFKANEYGYDFRA